MVMLARTGHGRLIALAAAAVASSWLAMASPASASAQQDPAVPGTETPALTLRGYLRDHDGDLVRIDPPGSEATKVTDINNRGQIVGTGYPDLDRPDEGLAYLRQRNGRYSVIDLPGDVNNLENNPAPVINDHGDIAGFYTDADGTTYHGFLRDHRGRFTTIDHPNAHGSTFVVSINNHGTVSGFYSDAGGTGHCFLRDRRGRFTTFDHPDADGSATPLGAGTGYCVINDRGDIAGAYAANGIVHAFTRDRRGTYRNIDMPGAVVTIPSAINNCSQIAGFYYVATAIDAPDGVNHGFLRDRRGHVTTIDHPRAVANGNGTTTYGLNDRGQTVGNYTGPVQYSRRCPPT